MTTFKLNGISLSAGAAENGLPLALRPFTTPGAGDYAARKEGRDRRRVRRAVMAGKRAFLFGM